MKLRNGFVSNSSSSSFVIGLDKKPKTKEELQKLLYPADEGVRSPYNWCDNISPENAAEAVWEQIKDQKPLTKKKFYEEINSGYFEGHPDHDFEGPHSQIEAEYRQLSGGKAILAEDTPIEWKNKWQKAWREHWDAHHKLCEAAAKEYGNKLLDKELKGKKLFRCTFSDNDGTFGCIMEHGETFKSIPHVRISQH